MQSPLTIHAPAGFLAALLTLLVASGPADAQRAVWSGNGHLYQVVSVPGGISWTGANTAALAAGGHLATITSDAEGAFVFSLVDAPQYWNQEPGGSDLGPWLGGYQTSDTGDPAANWVWVSGEPWSYTAWHSGEPNNFTGAQENYLSYKCWPTAGCRSALWNDLPDQISQFGTAVLSYVIEWDGPAGVDDRARAVAISLGPPMPNPFTASTTVRLSIPAAGQVRLTIVDVAGRRLRTLVDGELAAGSHPFEWDGRDESGRTVGPGCYFAHLVSGPRTSSVAMLRLR